METQKRKDVRADPVDVAGQGGVRRRSIVSALAEGIFARYNLIALADQSVVSVANFLTGLILARLGTKEQFGLYLLGFTIITLAMDFQDSLILTPYTIYSPRLKDDSLTRYSGSTLLHQIFFSAFVMTLLLLSRFALARGFGPPGLLPVVDALAFAVGLILLRYYARRVSFAALRMKDALRLDILVSALQIGGLLAVAGMGRLSAQAAYWVVGSACGLGIVPWWVAGRKEFTFRFRQAVSDLSQNISTGIWILASGFLWSTSVSLYPWLLATFHGTATTGVWAACLGIVTLFNPVYLGMQNSFSPRIAHTFASEPGDVFRSYSFRVTGWFGAAIAPFTLALLFAGEFLAVTVYGSQYAGTGATISLLAVNFLLSALSFPLSRALFTAGKAKIECLINVLMLLCLGAFGIVLVRSFGPVGAAVSLLISNLVCLGARMFAFSRVAPGKTETLPAHPETLIPTVSLEERIDP